MSDPIIDLTLLRPDVEDLDAPGLERLWSRVAPADSTLDQPSGVTPALRSAGAVDLATPTDRDTGNSHPRPQERRSAVRLVAVSAAAAVLAVVLLGSMTVSRTASSDRVDDVVLATGLLLPEVVPNGLIPKAASIQARDPSVAIRLSAIRVLALADRSDRNRQIRVQRWQEPVADGTWAEIADGMAGAQVRGASAAALRTSDAGATTIAWLNDGHRYQLDAAGMSVSQSLELAGAVAVDDDSNPTISPLPAGLDLAYRGPVQATGPSITLFWESPNDDRSLQVTFEGTDPWTAPSLVWGPGSPVDAHGIQAIKVAGINGSVTAWMNVRGVGQELHASKLDDTSLNAALASLRPVTAKTWAAFRHSLPPGPPLVVGGEARSRQDSQDAATTAVQIPKPVGPQFVDTALRTVDVPPGTYMVPDSTAMPGTGFAVVHLTDGRWLALFLAVDLPMGGCAVQARTSGGVLEGWQAPCSGARYAADGSCLSSCFVGLRSAPITLDSDQIKIAPDSPIPGQVLLAASAGSEPPRS